MSKSSPKVKAPIILMAWPLAGILISLLLYAVINFVLASSDIVGGSSLVTTIINVVLFVVFSGSIALGIPSFIVGLVLLILRLVPTSSASMGLGITGMILGIVSILTSFIAIGLVIGVVGICLSAAAIKRRSNGKGMAITGLVTSIMGAFISMIFAVAIILVAYAGVSQAAKSSTVKADAMAVSSEVESLYAANGEYPTYIELIESLSYGGNSFISGVNSASNSNLADKVGMYGSVKDIEYIPCYGDGGMVWYWDFEAKKYISIDLGNTSDCQY